MIGKIDFFGGGEPAPPAVSHFYKAIKAERAATDSKKINHGIPIKPPLAQWLLHCPSRHPSIVSTPSSSELN